MADIDDRKSALIAQLAEYRAQLSHHADGARERADFKRQIKDGIAANRFAWIGGAGLAGVLLAIARPWKSRRRETSNRPATSPGKGFALGALKLAFDLARPALVSMATSRAADFIAGWNRRKEQPNRTFRKT